MAGFSAVTGLESVMYADNCCFDGTDRDALIDTDGQFWIGNSSSPHVRIGTITSPLGTLTIGYAAPNITLDLAGGSTGIDSIAVQAGTSPVVPTAAGLVTFNGAVVAAGTTPVQSNGTAANTYALEIQTSQAIASTNAANIGLCAFDSAVFDVDANGFVTLDTGIIQGYVQIDNTDSPYTVLSTDYYISCDSSSGAITIELPNAPTTLRTFIIKDRVGSAATNNLTITTAGGVVTIDGATSRTMTANFESIQLLFNGTSYEVY